jgi:hypothetical protein
MTTRCCPNCQAPVDESKGQASISMCSRCGMAIPPARDGYIPGLRMHFKTVVILVSLFCVAMMLWLPR